MVSTDGHRLALSEHSFESQIHIAGGIMFPVRASELKRVLSDSDGIDQVELGFSERSGIMKAGTVVLSTRLVEGQFPDYQQVIPSQGDKQVKISRTRLAEALKRVSLLSQGRAWGVRLQPLNQPSTSSLKIQNLAMPTNLFKSSTAERT